MNTKFSPLVALLHYIGLLVMALFTFAGLSFLFGNVFTGIAGAVLVAALVEILIANLCKRKIQIEQVYNASTALRMLWGVYVVLALLTAPVLVHGFSIGVVERPSVERACTEDIEGLKKYLPLVQKKIDAINAADSIVSGRERINAENKSAPYIKAKRSIDKLIKNEGEQLKQTTLNPFNYLFFFERDLSEYNSQKHRAIEELKGLSLLSTDDVPPSLSVDVQSFAPERIAWGASLVFLIIVHILLLWKVYNISVSAPGKIRGGISSPGIHTFGK